MTRDVHESCVEKSRFQLDITSVDSDLKSMYIISMWVSSVLKMEP